MKKILFFVVIAFMTQSFALTKIVMNPGSSQIIQAGDTLEVTCTGESNSQALPVCGIKRDISEPSFGVSIGTVHFGWYQTYTQAINAINLLRSDKICR